MGQKVIIEIILRIKNLNIMLFNISRLYHRRSHVDQLTLIFRFMEETKHVERLVTFMPNQGHKSQEMFDGLIKFLTTNDIDLKNCRVQSYDYAYAISGKYNGLQAKVAAKNKCAEWIPFTGHSFNFKTRFQMWR